MTVTIREATQNDGKAIFELLNEAFDDEILNDSIFPDLLEKLKNERHYIYVATFNDIIVGTFSIRMRTKLNFKQRATIHAVAVKKSHQKQGIGKQMMLYAIDKAKNDFNAISIVVGPENDAVEAFYRKCGFTNCTWQGKSLDYIN